ncbi:MAG: Ig-like domain-containing protein, partial [Nitrososphaerales archaeon]
RTFVLPLTVIVGIPIVEISIGQELVATAIVTGTGGPLPNADVSWSAVGIQVISSQSVTDENGKATATIAGLAVGVGSVSARASKLSYGPGSVTVDLVVSEVAGPSLISSISTNILLMAGIALPVSLMVIWGVLRMKKRKLRNKNVF